MSTPEPAPTAPKPARRCNADYRWTVPKVEAFLRALGCCGKVAEAARAVGMSRQAAYRLKARLADPRFQRAFEVARLTGLRARRVERAEARRARSEWGEAGLAAYDYLRGDGSAARGDASRAQGDAPRPQGDAGSAQGDTGSVQGDASLSPRPGTAVQGHASRPRGDASGAQGDGSSRKAPF